MQPSSVRKVERRTFSRDASHPVARVPNCVAEAAGSIHVPRFTSALAVERNASASAFRVKVLPRRLL